MPGRGQAVEDFDDIFVSAEYEDKAAEGGQYESDDLIAGQPGGEESEGEEECAQEQCAQIAGADETKIGIAQKEQHQHDGQAAGQDQCVEAERGEVFAEHGLERVEGQGHQQFEGVLGVFFGPGAHGEGRDEGDQ